LHCLTASANRLLSTSALSEVNIRRRIAFQICVIAHFNPACLRILFCVPGARSSLGFPAIVTTPFFLSCLYCRWLPRVRSRYQPSSSMSLIIARTFIAANAADSISVRQISTNPGRPSEGWESFHVHGRTHFVAARTGMKMSILR